MNILNPKIPLFFVACLPQFIPPLAPVGRLVELKLVSSVLTALTFLVYVGVAAATARGGGLGIRLATERA